MSHDQSTSLPSIKIVALGSVYVETNYLGVETASQDHLDVGKEYRGASYEIGLGGSAVNFATQCQKLGAQVSLIGKHGQDETGAKLQSLLTSAGIDTSLLHADPLVQTAIDTGIVLSHTGQNIQLVAGNANSTLSRSDIDMSLPAFANSDAVYLGGYFKQDTLFREYPQICEAILKSGKQVFLDPGRIPVSYAAEKLSVLKHTLPFVSGYFPNEEELLGVTGVTDLNEALRLVERMGPKLVAVKRGRAGCVVYTDGKRMDVLGHPVKVLSTVGAGDCFNAAFIMQLPNGSIEDAARYAVAASALRVSKNHQPDDAEIRAFMKLNS